MATVNLGNIKFNWKGTWSNSTTYSVDDVVSYSGSSYISIQAGSNQNPASASAYWQQMSSAGTNGTNGTDVGTVITTQGDILYRDGSGLQRLGAGTSGQVLKTQGAGANPVWGTDAGGSILQVKHATDGDRYVVTNEMRQSNYNNFASNSYNIAQLNITMTPSSNTSKFLIQCHIQASHNDSYVGLGWLSYQVSGGTEYAITSNGTRGVTFRYDDGSVATSNAGNMSIAHCIMAEPATTSNVTFRVRLATASSGTPFYVNRSPGNQTDVDDGGYTLSTMTVFEIDGSKGSQSNYATSTQRT